MTDRRRIHPRILDDLGHRELADLLHRLLSDTLPMVLPALERADALRPDTDDVRGPLFTLRALARRIERVRMTDPELPGIEHGRIAGRGLVEFDDLHPDEADGLDDGELMRVAAAYLDVAQAARVSDNVQEWLTHPASRTWGPWPFVTETDDGPLLYDRWHPSNDIVRNLAMVIAYAAEEIDRIQRARAAGTMPAPKEDRW